jgi:hypothetical protein
LRPSADAALAAAREIPAPQPTVAQHTEIRDNGGRDVPATSADAADAAQRHRPQDRREFQRAARDLMAQGLTTDDVARVLRITRRAVLDLLAEHLAEVPPKYRRPDL